MLGRSECLHAGAEARALLESLYNWQFRVVPSMVLNQTRNATHWELTVDIRLDTRNQCVEIPTGCLAAWLRGCLAV